MNISNSINSYLRLAESGLPRAEKEKRPHEAFKVSIFWYILV